MSRVAVFTPIDTEDPFILNQKGEVIVLRPLTEAEADLDEVGPMYQVKSNVTGDIFDVFEDELSGNWTL